MVFQEQGQFISSVLTHISFQFTLNNFKKSQNMNTLDTFRNNVFRYVKYSSVNAIGFLIVELLSYITVETEFNELLGVSMAYGLSILTTFMINSTITVWNGFDRRPKIPVERFPLYVISGIVATVSYILFQYFLYVDMGISPLIGNLLGGVFITPLNYYFRMRKVWEKRVIF